MAVRYHKKLKKGRKLPQLYGLTIFVLVMLTVAIIIDARLRPIIKTMSAYQAQMYATRSINNAIEEELRRNDQIKYENLVHLTQNSNGDITSVQVNMVSVNRLRADITSAVINKMLEHKEQTLYIPIGTLVGGQYLSGRGPRIEFKIIPASYAKSEIYNEFKTAGINQTHHQIMLKLSTTVTAIIPGYSVSTEVITNVCLAETVIVGTVPEAYTHVETNDPAVEENRANYAAEPRDK